MVSGEKTSASLAEIQDHLHESDLGFCLAALNAYWLDHPNDLKAIALLAEVMFRLGCNDLAEGLQRLTREPQVQDLFEVGHRLIDLRLHKLAVMILSQCAEEAPDEPVIQYELGFALMSSGEYQKAINHFEMASVGSDDFDTNLNLAVCHLYLRQLVAAKNVCMHLALLASGQEEREEAAHQKMVLKRLEMLSKKVELSVRDWLFAQYGAALLKLSSDPGSKGKFGVVVDDYGKVAHTLLTLQAVLEKLGCQVEVVEFYSPLSRPLAEALAQIMDVPCEIYSGLRQEERVLTMMAWASDIIGPHQSFKPHQEHRTLFAYALSSAEPLPIIMDIVGYLAESSILPWEDDWRADGEPDWTKSGDEAPKARARLDAVVNKIMSKVQVLQADPDVLHSIQEPAGYYSLKRELLLLGNAAVLPQRPEYTAEMPV